MMSIRNDAATGFFRRRLPLLAASIAVLGAAGFAVFALPATGTAEADGLASDAPIVLAQAASAPQSEGSVDMEAVLEEGALPDMAIGEDDAPVTIVEYMSMTCPHCASFHNETFDAVKEQYVDTGQVRFILREFPFDPRRMKRT